MKKFVALAALSLAAPALAQSASTMPITPSPVATAIAARLLPNGMYRQMLGGNMKQMIADMTDNMGKMPLGPLLKAAGLDASTATKLDQTSLQEIMAIIDPYYAERMRRTTAAMFDAMIPVMEKMEPDIRAGLAVSLQRRFSTAQLNDLAAFFATPTGSAYAGQQMTLYTDPAVMERMQAQMPKLMEAMPAIIAEAAKATSDLPKQRTYKDLSPADKKRLEDLLGVDPAKLNNKND